jgi:hypothetical protein
MSKSKKGVGAAKLIQQGDVLCHRQEKLPEGLKDYKPTERGIVLAEGEATGHAHTIVADGKCQAFVDEMKKVWLVVKDAPVTIRHQEHKEVKLGQGVWKIDLVREVDPFTDEIHAVHD